MPAHDAEPPVPDNLRHEREEAAAMLDSAFERYALTFGQDWGERMNLIHVIRRYVEAEVRVAVRQHESQHHT